MLLSHQTHQATTVSQIEMSQNKLREIADDEQQAARWRLEQQLHQSHKHNQKHHKSPRLLVVISQTKPHHPRNHIYNNNTLAAAKLARHLLSLLILQTILSHLDSHLSELAAISSPSFGLPRVALAGK